MTSRTLASIDLGTERLVIRMTDLRGRKQIDLRVFDGSGFPTKGGFSVDPERLLELRAAIDTTIEEARAQGLLPSPATPHKRSSQ